MGNHNFHVLSIDNLDSSDYIEIRAGKHRKKTNHSSSLYFHKSVFTIFEEVIWVKYREYSPSLTNIIRVDDWSRILDGMNDYLQIIEKNNTKALLKEVLDYQSYDHLMDNEYDEHVHQDLIQMIQEFIQYINNIKKKDKYISICV